MHDANFTINYSNGTFYFVLPIPSVQYIDSAFYTCFVGNPYGVSSGNVTLIVKGMLALLSQYEWKPVNFISVKCFVLLLILLHRVVFKWLSTNQLVITPSNRNCNQNKHCNEPSRIASSYPQLAQSMGKITCTSCDRSRPCISLVEKVAGDFKRVTRGSDCNRVISFNSHWKAAASVKFYWTGKNKLRKEKWWTF